MKPCGIIPSDFVGEEHQMYIPVVGGADFVGSHFCDRLLADVLSKLRHDGSWTAYEDEHNIAATSHQSTSSYLVYVVEVRR